MRLRIPDIPSVDDATIASYTRYAALVGVVAIIVALGAWLVVGEISTWIEIVGAVGILLIALTVLVRPSEVKAALTGRQARYGGNALLMSVSFLMILGLVNYLGTRHHQRWDVTEEKQFSLSEQTIQILEALEEPVQVKLFFTPAHYNRQKAEDLIKEYALHSQASAGTVKLTYEFIDPDLQRHIALDYQIARDGTIVFERGERSEVTFGVQEQDLTSALLKVTRDETKSVYFLTGHQERDPESEEQDGYSLVKQVLENENYTVAMFNLAATDIIPADMSLLVVAGPVKSLAPQETATLQRFVADGGSLLLLVEPGMDDPFGGLLSEYGIELADDLIIDPARSFFGDIASPLVDHYAFHQITKDLSGLTSFFPTARSLVLSSPQAEEWNVQLLATTSERSWAETGYREKQVQYDEGEIRGPLGLMAVIEPATPGTGKGRLVVVGDASFAENGVLNAVRGGVGNLDLFMNAVGWLTEEEELISIRPKMPEQRQVFLTLPQARAVIYSNILFMPLIVLAAGAVVWWKRR